MPKDARYHEAVIRYNDAIASFAEEFAETLDHPEVKQLCLGLASHHRWHEANHKVSLEKANDPERIANKKAKNKARNKARIERKRMEREAREGKTYSGDALAEDPGTALGEKPEDEEVSPEETARLNAEIERIHGPGAVEALDAAYADESIFSDANRVESTPDSSLAAEPVDSGVGTPDHVFFQEASYAEIHAASDTSRPVEPMNIVEVDMDAVEINPSVIEVAPGITRPMTDEEKAARQALIEQENANG